ncbi:hypothetical protein ABE033_13755 [Priestia megaterium]
MDSNKLVQAKLLGELYRIQKRLDNCYVSDEVIYGLLNGVERIINDELDDLFYVSEEDENAVINILNEYYKDEDKLSAFTGYYDIEHKLEAAGIGRSKAIRILTLLKAEGRFTNVIEKMDSSNSPGECRTFRVADWNK